MGLVAITEMFKSNLLLQVPPGESEEVWAQVWVCLTQGHHPLRPWAVHLSLPLTQDYRHVPGDFRSRDAEEKDQEEKGQGWLEQGERRREMLSNYEEVF